eukprot:GHVO01050504.1.p1 GENE.GHVO01050504.1~~GHVO01050504.1.p1  ORF type:complete len:359 (-),score=42.63 GHVO01050504.1:651-1727(-)
MPKSDIHLRTAAVKALGVCGLPLPRRPTDQEFTDVFFRLWCIAITLLSDEDDKCRGMTSAVVYLALKRAVKTDPNIVQILDERQADFTKQFVDINSFGILPLILKAVSAAFPWKSHVLPLLSTLSLSFSLLAFPNPQLISASVHMKTAVVPLTDEEMKLDKFEKARLAFGYMDKQKLDADYGYSYTESFDSTVEEEASNLLNEDHFLGEEASTILISQWKKKTSDELAKGSIEECNLVHALQAACRRTLQSVLYCQSKLYKHKDDLLRCGFVLSHEHVVTFLDKVLSGCCALFALVKFEAQSKRFSVVDLSEQVFALKDGAEELCECVAFSPHLKSVVSRVRHSASEAVRSLVFSDCV